jgi:hypothetical protein
MTTKAQARKNLKKAAKAHKEKVRQPVVVEFQAEHLAVLLKSLEVFQRLKLGQVDIALDEAFGYSLAYEDKQEIHNCARKYLFKGTDLENNPNVSYGIYNQEKVGDATMAYEIYKTLGRYKAFKDNDGWADFTRRFDKPHSHTGVPLPVVQGAIEHKLFKVPKRLWKKLDATLNVDYAGDWNDIWKSIDKAMPKLPRGEKAEIISEVDAWYVKVYSPIKPKELEEI